MVNSVDRGRWGCGWCLRQQGAWGFEVGWHGCLRSPASPFPHLLPPVADLHLPHPVADVADGVAACCLAEAAWAGAARTRSGAAACHGSFH
eukprot:149969-Rhodomonas_salina.2